MLGAVFTSFIEMLEDKFPEDVVESVFDKVPMTDDGAYIAVGYYPDAELVSILTALAEETGENPDVLLQTFGQFLFHKLVELHEGMLQHLTSLLDLLAHLDDEIHPQVRKLYPEVVVPVFTVVEKSEKHIVIDYQSPRKLYMLALGLIEGAATFFNVEIQCTYRQLSDVTRFTVNVQ